MDGLSATVDMSQQLTNTDGATSPNNENSR